MALMLTETPPIQDHYAFFDAVADIYAASRDRIEEVIRPWQFQMGAHHLARAPCHLVCEAAALTSVKARLQGDTVWTPTSKS